MVVFRFALFILLLTCASVSIAQKPKSKDLVQIMKTMDSQEDSWNKGDLRGFMRGYWESDSLKFVSKSGVTYGWSATLARYEKGYPDKEAMGKLTFTILHVEPVGRNFMFVTGKWHLQRAEDAPEGHFTLLWRKVKGEWVIVADHSS